MGDHSEIGIFGRRIQNPESRIQKAVSCPEI
jgi:hypothetical protein